MTWITPKLDWNDSNWINYADWNRIENNILELSNYLSSIQYAMPPLSENTSSLSFDGVDDYVSITPSVALTNINITLECWVYLDSTIKNGAFIKIGDSSSGFGIGVGNANFDTTSQGNTLLGLFETLRWINTGQPLGLGWVHVALVIDGAGLPSIYMNGILIGSYAGTVAVVPSSNNNVGGYTAGVNPRYFNGNIDDIRIWNVARTQSEIQANMYKSLTGVESGLIGYWRCNDGTGTTLTAAKGSNGTLVNGTTWTTNVSPVLGDISKNRTVSSIDFLSSINRIENNLDALRVAFLTPADYLPKKTWTVGLGFDYTDANRLESNTNSLLNWGMLVFQSYRYSGTFSCGESGGLE